MNQIFDPVVFKDFFEQYSFNSISGRVELEKMLRAAVHNQCVEMNDFDRNEVVSDCESLIEQARQSI